MFTSLDLSLVRGRNAGFLREADYYLVSEGQWQDREGYGGDRFAYRSFRDKTQAWISD